PIPVLPSLATSPAATPRLSVSFPSSPDPATLHSFPTRRSSDLETIMIHFISTTATETTCPRCRARLLTAFDEGLRVTVDAEPLAKPADEIAALLAGKWTYTL